MQPNKNTATTRERKVAKGSLGATNNKGTVASSATASAPATAARETTNKLPQLEHGIGRKILPLIFAPRLMVCSRHFGQTNIRL
jgi:hypothetical protein